MEEYNKIREIKKAQKLRSILNFQILFL